MTSCGYAPSKSRHRQSRENPIDYRLARHALGFGFVAHDDAVAQNIRPDAFDILRRDIAAAVQEGVGAGGKREVNRGARRSAIRTSPSSSSRYDAGSRVAQTTSTM